MKQKIFVIVATIVTIVINVLANLIPYNNKTTAQISDAFPVYFVPAGYVFSIWGLIYLAIIAYSYYQFKFVKNDDKNFEEIASWFIIGSFANCVWIFLWHYEYIVATIFMMGLLLASLIGIYLEIKKIKKQDKYFKWMVKGTFSLYLGWISVATIANLTDVLFALGYDGGIYASYWGFAMVLVAGILGSIMVLRERDYVFTGVIVWALVGIAVKFNMVSIIYGGVYAALIILATSILIAEIDKKQKKKDKNTTTDK